LFAIFLRALLRRAIAMTKDQLSKNTAAAPRVPALVQFLGRNMVFGMSVGVALASSMILTNAAGLNDLIAGDHNPFLMVFLLEFMFALTFASLAMGIAVMTMRSHPANDDGPGDEPPRP
jgi:branched-subunit amino acid transport protein AzlD